MPKQTDGHAKKRIFLMEDHPVTRKGLGQLLENQSDLEICGEHEEIAGAIAAISKAKPDIVIMDLSLKNGSGLQLIADLRKRMPELPILVLSMHDEYLYVERSLRAGARGYITKSEPGDKLIKAIRRVLAGNVYISEKSASKMVSMVADGGNSPQTSLVEKLTDREFELFELFGGGLGAGVIAKRLHISTKTVEAHREHMKRKLNLVSATELLTYAVQWVQSGRPT